MPTAEISSRQRKAKEGHHARISVSYSSPNQITAHLTGSYVAILIEGDYGVVKNACGGSAHTVLRELGRLARGRRRLHADNDQLAAIAQINLLNVAVLCTQATAMITMARQPTVP
jgi:hypothetical protein